MRRKETFKFVLLKKHWGRKGKEGEREKEEGGKGEVRGEESH